MTPDRCGPILERKVAHQRPIRYAAGSVLATLYSGREVETMRVRRDEEPRPGSKTHDAEETEYDRWKSDIGTERETSPHPSEEETTGSEAHTYRVRTESRSTRFHRLSRLPVGRRRHWRATSRQRVATRLRIAVCSPVVSTARFPSTASTEPIQTSTPRVVSPSSLASSGLALTRVITSVYAE